MKIPLEFNGTANIVMLINSSETIEPKLKEAILSQASHLERYMIAAVQAAAKNHQIPKWHEIIEDQNGQKYPGRLI
jgi:hypothetical protein